MAGDGSGQTESVLPDAFDVFYREQIEPALARMEDKRRRGVKFLLVLAVAGLLGLALFALVASNTMGGGTPVIVAGILLVCGAVAGAIWIQRDLRNKIKMALVEPTCRSLGYQYTPKADKFPVDRFSRLKLIRHNPRARIKSEDMICGTCNAIPFRLCEAEVTEPRRRNNDDRSEARTLFRGLLFACEFPQALQGETRVLHGADRSLLPKKAADGTPIEAVHLEESRFSQAFHVYASDQVEARYLLTPSFMERLAALVDHFNPVSQATRDLPGADQSGLLQFLAVKANPVSVAFVASQMLISIRTSDDRFEGGSIFKQLVDRERVEALRQELKIVPQILDTLQL